MEVVSLAPNWQSSIRAKEAFRSCAALPIRCKEKYSKCSEELTFLKIASCLGLVRKVFN